MIRKQSTRDKLFIVFGSYTFIENFRGVISPLRWRKSMDIPQSYDHPRFSNEFVHAMADD